MHTHVTNFKGSGTCRIKDKVSGPHFVAALLIVPRSHGQVDDMRVKFLRLTGQKTSSEFRRINFRDWVMYYEICGIHFFDRQIQKFTNCFC